MMSWRNATGWLVAFAALVVFAYSAIDADDENAPSNGSAAARSEPTTPGQKAMARVLRVVDGDTIVVRATGAGGDERGPAVRVRYIGVDTPESVKPDTPVECFGKEAARANRRLVDGKTVELVSDRELYDKYGRTLAFVYVNGKFVNAELIRKGYAETIEVPPNTSKADEFAALQRVAIRTNTGLWGACDR